MNSPKFSLVRYWWAFAIFFVLFVLLPLNTFQHSGTYEISISQSVMRKSWPFKFSSGNLKCFKPLAVVITDSDSNTTYALNGNAEMQMQERGWISPQAVRKENKPLDPLISRGLQLCKCSILEFRPICPPKTR